MAKTHTKIDLQTLAALHPISDLLEEQIVELTEQCKEAKLPAGHQLFKIGDAGKHLIYLLEGEVEIQPNHGDSYTISGKTTAGRHALNEHAPLRSNGKTLTPVHCVALDRDLVDTMLTWAQSTSSDNEEVIMSGTNVLHIDRGGLKRKMQNSPTFRKLPAANIEQALEKMAPLAIEAGEIIMRQGESGDYFYVIEKGEALVTRITEDDEDSDDSVEMAQLCEGSAFGEAALISDKPRNATVSMQTDGVLLRLNKDDFLSLMQEPLQNWISFDEAQQRVTQGAQWIDVRSRSEYQHDHLPGAINIPLNESHRLAQTLDKSKHHICYCPTGRRSSAATFILSQYGIQCSVIKDGLSSTEMPISTQVSNTKA